ncbi:SRPBCC family protein [Actinomadura graeca]|uniref:SRPBCC family protein n=1 Tax=Actinomadura graeca TaxID=2750812 RepID=A0ABX8QT67_9ACTN|nr:SRPBCC family protein [Actinomadura graeca]QXJ21828.1 SRPBCC family protein [Actinomadura graeca]
MPAHTENAIVIAAPLDFTWEVTNDVAGWPGLFGEYSAAEILEQEDGRVLFRLTMHPDDDGNVWSWVSERILDRGSATVTARRVETGPFEYMRIHWAYEEVPEGTRMVWKQDFHMKPGAPVDDTTMEARINRTSKVQMALVKSRVEERFRAQAATA